MKPLQDVLQDILSRRDPHGYFVIPVDPDRVDEVLRGVNTEVLAVYANDAVLLKTRSRGLAAKLARAAARLNALVTDL